jgi:hypothetical protein
MRKQQQLLDGRQAILQQRTQLLVPCRIKIAADDDAQRG